MTNICASLRVFCATLLLSLACSAHAGWTLDAAQSSLQFVSIKNVSVAEVHHFQTLSGSVSDAGEARVEIDLASVETMIPIRNERMREMLFEVAEFPRATVTVLLDSEALDSLVDRERQRMTLPVKLSLHGFEHELSVTVEAVRADERLYVYSPGPVLISAADFGLDAGITKLREVAGLNSISTTVPVTFSLQFTAN